VKRISSVCSGAFVLARAGILDGRRAATHWSACARLAAYRAQVTVDSNAIFVKDGRVWTSAGVTAGIDMSLAIVEEDHGARVADAIAAHFVLYLRRPGFQSQFSGPLIAQRHASEPLGDLLVWANANLRANLSAAKLARRAGMSRRTFHRRCIEHFSTTPAKLIEGLRVEHARTLLTTTTLGTKTIAARSGFGSPGQMARVFKRTVGVAPSEYALLHGRRAA
jgi:transcriptional regulator GlxA family with amidase domain